MDKSLKIWFISFVINEKFLKYFFYCFSEIKTLNDIVNLQQDVE